jgi:hypothetical protein
MHMLCLGCRVLSAKGAGLVVFERLYAKPEVRPVPVGPRAVGPFAPSITTVRRLCTHADHNLLFKVPAMCSAAAWPSHVIVLSIKHMPCGNLQVQLLDLGKVASVDVLKAFH